MIPWEEVINNDPLGTLPECKGVFLREDGEQRLMRATMEQKAVVLNLISIQEAFILHFVNFKHLGNNVT